ncbi:MAG: ferredoxin reductase family protein [Alphaproteobacteria bacterium]
MKQTPGTRAAVASRRPPRFSINAAVLLAVYVLVASAPLILAYMQGLPRRGLIDEVSSSLSMVAFAMLLMEFVLSGRFEIVSGSIGIDRTMRFHQLTARWLAAFILIHPFLYLTPLKHPLPWDTTGQLTLGLDTASIVTGIVAWVLLAPLVLFGIYRDQLPLRYEAWRLTHGLGAALIAAAGAHHAIEAGRYSGHPYLAGFWLVMLGVALFTLIHVYVLTPLRQLGRPYRVVSVKKIALKTWELVIEPKSGEAMDFDAGQFVWLTLNRSAFAITEHPFSISSCPADRPLIGFTIKQAGDFTNAIGSVPAGAPAYIDGPHGNLTLAGRKDAGIVFIAGGVGLAPIMSILRQLRAEGDPRPLKLVYGNRVVEQIICRDELEEMKDSLDLEIYHVISEPPPGWSGAAGQLDASVLRSCLGFDGRAGWLYVVCGPGPMIDSVEDSLRALGAPRRQIVSEKFSSG